MFRGWSRPRLHLWLGLALLVWGMGALGLGCSGEVSVTQPGCEDCPDRCIREGNRGKCVACLTDQHCQSDTSPTRKCLDNKCICGSDQDCPSGQVCNGEQGCSECRVSADCKSAELTYCFQRTCVACEPGTTRSCTPGGLVPCLAGLQTCKSSGSWGPCEGAIACQPNERCINSQCYVQCPEPQICQIGEKQCTTAPNVAPGKYKECKLSEVDQCNHFEETEQFCGSDEVCEKGACKPK